MYASAYVVRLNEVAKGQANLPLALRVETIRATRVKALEKNGASILCKIQKPDEPVTCRSIAFVSVGDVSK